MSKHFLGIDLGSSYTKFVVVNQSARCDYSAVVPTLSRRREEFDRSLDLIRNRFRIGRVCTTGYGRHNFGGELKKTELICASVGVSALYPIHKGILDIGGEDIKIIESGPGGEVAHFYMNDKCSAGTGAFVTEIAERAELDLAEMSEFARRSTANRTINSFCTVFAKSEILSWKFDGVPIEDIARGIYLSIVDRICKLPMRTDLPMFLCGGVIAFHPYLKDLLAEQLRLDVQIVPDPQFMVAFGAAIIAKNSAGGSNPAGG
jgi:predicted CoA-substrate-specific enzyme activase